MTAYLYAWQKPCPFFRYALVGFGLFLATLRPDTFSDLFGPVADIPHVEGVRGTGAFVFLTCVV